MTVWEGIKEIILTKSESKQNINSLRLSRTLCTELKNIADSLNMFLARYLKKSKKINPHNKDFSYYLKDPANSTFCVSPTNPQEVENSIKPIKQSDSAAYQQISSKLFQTFQLGLYQNNKPILCPG